MRALLTRFIGVIVFVSILGSNLVLPGLARVARAQGTANNQNQINCNDPAVAKNNPICNSVDPQDIREAINSPTPNLANTTAYVLFTILVILTGDNDTSVINPNNTGGGATNSGGANTGDPSSENSQSSNINQAIKTNGLAGGFMYLIAEMVKNQPASGGKYVAYMVDQSRLTPEPVYAQGFGIGFGALDPILGTWAAFRDVAYFLLTVMFLVTGLLIIMRHKVSGNVAVTVQNALPRLVITLVLITFSYAVAGLMIDLMYWAIYFLINIFSNMFDGDITLTSDGWNPFDSTEVPLREFALDSSIFHLSFAFFAEGGANAASEAISDLLNSAIKGVPVLRWLEGLDFLGLADWIFKQLFQLIIGVALLVQVFRVFFKLIMSYAGFVINVVLSPFILLAGALPSGGNGLDPFTNWVKNLIGGLAPFVTSIFLLFMAFALTGKDTIDGIGYQNRTDNSGLRLPLIMTKQVGDANAFLGILSLGFIFLLPEAVDMTKEMVGAKGGPFDKYKDKAIKNLQKGWEGGEAVPGLGFTKVPGAKTLAPKIASKAGAGAIGGTAGAYYLGRKAWQKPQPAEDAGFIGRKATTLAKKGAAAIGGGFKGLTVGALTGAGAKTAIRATKSKTTERIAGALSSAADIRQLVEEEMDRGKYKETMSSAQDTDGGPAAGGKKAEKSAVQNRASRIKQGAPK